jgi:hypothetical protein
MRIVDPAFMQGRTGTPHTWHAAEMFFVAMDLDAR